VCEEAEIRVVGRSVFVRLRSGATAFIPIEKFCEAVERYGICFEDNEKIRC